MRTAAYYSVAPVPLIDALWFHIFPTTIPKVGSIAVFEYPNDYHVAVVTGIEVDGFWVIEGNYRPCEITHRFIAWDDPRLLKFVL